MKARTEQLRTRPIKSRAIPGPQHVRSDREFHDWSQSTLAMIALFSRLNRERRDLVVTVARLLLEAQTPRVRR